jgi:hypothetical protein
MRNRTPVLPPYEGSENSNTIIPPERSGNGNLENTNAGTPCSSEADRDMGPLIEIISALRRRRFARSCVTETPSSPVAEELSRAVQDDSVIAVQKKGAVTYLQLVCVDGRHADLVSQTDVLGRASLEAMAILRTLLDRCSTPPEEA